MSFNAFTENEQPNRQNTTSNQLQTNVVDDAIKHKRLEGVITPL